MRFVIVATRSETASPDEFTPEILQAESKTAFKLMADDFLRELYSRTDGKGAILVVEAASEDEVKEKLGTLPLAQKNLLSAEIYGIKAYRAIAAMADA